uniref:Uncharacterized protein n=1 Tax=Vespula pensylvanica TaxID=30213 RepID=A0A834PBW7_VESPE|nr:hypothetical protein H0235_003477 [Vespula pensylvanica]
MGCLASPCDSGLHPPIHPSSNWIPISSNRKEGSPSTFRAMAPTPSLNSNAPLVRKHARLRHLFSLLCSTTRLSWRALLALRSLWDYQRFVFTSTTRSLRESEIYTAKDILICEGNARRTVRSEIEFNTGEYSYC